MFVPHIRPTKHAEQDEIDAERLGKKLAFWRKNWCAGKNIIIANKSIKKTQKNWVFQWILFHSWTPQSVSSLVATATGENTACSVHSVK